MHPNTTRRLAEVAESDERDFFADEPMKAPLLHISLAILALVGALAFFVAVV